MTHISNIVFSPPSFDSQRYLNPFLDRFSLREPFNVGDVGDYLSKATSYQPNPYTSCNEQAEALSQILTSEFHERNTPTMRAYQDWEFKTVQEGINMDLCTHSFIEAVNTKTNTAITLDSWKGIVGPPRSINK